MEALGAAAAATQLFGMVITIVAGLVQIREALQNASKRLRGWRDELLVLEALMACIRENESLHAVSIRVILEAIAGRVAAVADLLGRHDFPVMPNRARVKNPVKKLASTLTFSFSLEPRILQDLAALERDKTSLIIAIYTIQGSILEGFVGRSGMPQTWREAPSLPPEASEELSLDPAAGQRLQQQQQPNSQRVTILCCVQPTEMAQNQTSPRLSPPQTDPVVDGNSATEHQATSGGYTENLTEGDDNNIVNLAPGPVIFRGNTIKGHRNMMGNMSESAFLQYLQSKAHVKTAYTQFQAHDSATGASPIQSLGIFSIGQHLTSTGDGDQVPAVTNTTDEPGEKSAVTEVDSPALGLRGGVQALGFVSRPMGVTGEMR